MIGESKRTLAGRRSAARTAARPPLFEGVFLGGFECACQKLEDGRRLDLTAATRHDELARADYARLRSVGMTAARDGVCWVKVQRPGTGFDFSSVTPLVRAADQYHIQVLWDLMHFGWPEDIDVFAPSFPSRFARYAGAFAHYLTNESDQRLMVTPINEISFLAWAGGDVRCLNPFEAARGVELKVQFVRATIEAIEAIRAVSAGARFLQPEPAIHIVPALEHPKTWRRVESDNLLQFQAWDMLTGRVWPSLGGHPKYLDIVGVNYYPDNQFMLDGTTIFAGDLRYRPFSKMLLEIWSRYRRPMLVSETGTEGDARASWLKYVCGQCVRAMREGCELHGITLYPVLSHPGFVDERHCENGLWDYADRAGHRPAHRPLLEQMRRQRSALAAARAEALGGGSLESIAVDQ
jgi:hypothetical protein